MAELVTRAGVGRLEIGPLGKGWIHGQRIAGTGVLDPEAQFARRALLHARRQLLACRVPDAQLVVVEHLRACGVVQLDPLAVGSGDRAEIALDGDVQPQRPLTRRAAVEGEAVLQTRGAIDEPLGKPQPGAHDLGTLSVAPQGVTGRDFLHRAVAPDRIQPPAGGEAFALRAVLLHREVQAVAVKAGAQPVPRVLRVEHAVRLRRIRPHRMAGRLVGGSDGVILPALLELSDGLFPREGNGRRHLPGVGSEGGPPGEQGGDEGEDADRFHGMVLK